MKKTKPNKNGRMRNNKKRFSRVHQVFVTSTRNAGIARRQILNSFTDGRQSKKIIFSQKKYKVDLYSWWSRVTMVMAKSQNQRKR